MKRGSSALALAIPGVGTLGVSTSMWLAHAPFAVAIVVGIVVGLGTVATAVVAIVKIRSGRSPEQVRAESQAALAKKLDDKQAAMLLTTLDALVSNKQADIPALQEGLIQLLPRPASPSIGGPTEVPSPAPPGDDYPDAPKDPDVQISDEQLRRIVGDQPDSNADPLTRGRQLLLLPGN
jgi:hypothetical protein